MALNLDLSPIGVFDSGVGGLSVLRAIRQQIPSQPVIFFADQAHVPYGPRDMEEVRTFSKQISRFLLANGARLIVVACNAASAAALYSLRSTFPEVPFVGMEPAVKPAAEKTASGVVGVLATPATFQGALYASVLDRFAQGVKILQDPCLGLVPEIEAGNLNSPSTRLILEKALKPMLAQGIDTVVLACTHYPFVIPLIQEIVGPDVRVIDPAPAIARQTARQLEAHGWAAPGPQTGSLKIYTSGQPQKLSEMVPMLLGETITAQPAFWTNGSLAARA
ncbi:MAG: glutamate racemase [Anaerolineaceae bacterium]|nr:glutamate racemase [Anaerolineaceae bacterium]